ncbi:MAG TPA: tetratricopeptide repeat protein [Armatimonadota bacterium]|nr:tetratricopeptide repeat protein [Armatimonadota bacterium]
MRMIQGGVAHVMVALLVSVPLAETQAQEGNRIEKPGVILLAADDVQLMYPGGVADVVATARAAFEDLFPEIAPETVNVLMSKAPGYYEHVTTSRTDAIFVCVGSKGFGERWRPDAGPVAILCESIVELSNLWRLPGFERYVAHRYLIPSVIDELGTEPLPNARLDGDIDDPTGLFAVVTDPLYASAHPDYAATRALLEIDEELGLDGLKDLIYDLPEGADDPLSLLREAAVAAEPALADAFEMRDAAMTLEADEEGSCLIASFEEDRPLSLRPMSTIADVGELPFMCSTAFEFTQSDEWSTDGDLSLKLTSPGSDNYLSTHILDADWKYKDWTRFSRFEMDLLLVADEPQRLRIWAADHASAGHGQLPIWDDVTVQPGEEYHISLQLTPDALVGETSWRGGYFDGEARAREIADLILQFPPPSGPFTIYIDNIRLVLRDENAPPVGMGGPPVAAPATAAVAETAEENASRREEQAEAGEAVTAALAEKRKGNLREAEGLLRAAIALDDGNVEAHRVLGWTLADQGRKPEAAEEFRKVIALTEDAAVRKASEDALKRLE